MTLLVLLGALAAGGADAPAPGAQAPAAAAPVSSGQAGAASNAVVRYDAAFFASMLPNTAFDMIGRVPGFVFDPGAQVRGFAGAAGNVLIDGERPTSKDDDLQSILKRVPASQVDHIDVIRGGAPGIDMHGQTVIANVVRKTGSSSTGVVALANTFVSGGRYFPDSRLEMIRKWGGGRTLELALVSSMYPDDSVGEGTRVRTDADGDVLIRSLPKDRAAGANATGTAAYETPLWGGKFRVNVLGTWDGYHQHTDDTLIVPPGEEKLRYHQNKTRGEVGLHFEKKLSPKLSLEALGIQKIQSQEFPSHFYTTAGEDDRFNESDISGESILRGVLRYRASDKLSAETSLEGAYNIQTSDSTFASGGVNVPLPAAHVTVSEKRGEAAALTTWSPSKKITLEAGARFEISQIASRGDVVLSKVLFYPKPRVVLTWSLDDNDQVRFRVEREVGQLNFADFAAASALGAGDSVARAGNPNLNPQSDWAYEAAFEKHIQGAVLVFTYRRLQISNVVDRIPIAAPDGTLFDAPGNIGDATENDFLTNITLPLDRIGLKGAQFKASGTLRHSRVIDPTTGLLRTISGQHRFDYELHFTQDLPKLKSDWGIDVFNRWTETYFRFNEIDVYKLKTMVGAFFEYRPTRDISIRGEFYNLGARGAERTLIVYAGPRNSSPLSYVDDRKEGFDPYVRLRVRKNFG
jgi:hypothetical protein